jgi:hypothetical protein
MLILYTHLENHFNLHQLIFVQKKSLTHTITDSPYKVKQKENRSDEMTSLLRQYVTPFSLQHITHTCVRARTAMICRLTWPLPHDTTNTIIITLYPSTRTDNSNINQSIIHHHRTTSEPPWRSEVLTAGTITRSSALPKNLPLILSRQPKRQCLQSMENRGSQLEAIPARSKCLVS